MHQNEHFYSETTTAETLSDCTNCGASGAVLGQDFESEDCAVCDGTGAVTTRRSARIINLPIRGARALAA